MVPSNMENKKKRIVAKDIEDKTGKDYTVHSALNHFIEIEEYNIKKAFVLSNERKVYTKGVITYIPIYYIMFFNHTNEVVGEW